jgi:DNA-binding NarL/FixJ family response regulator
MGEPVDRPSHPHGIRVVVAGVEAKACLAAVLPAIDGAEVVAEAPTASAAVGLASLHQPDLVVIDFLMDDMTAVGAIPSLHRSARQSAVVVVAPPELRGFLGLAVRFGADGVLATDAQPAEMVAQLESILDRRRHDGRLVKRSP